MYHFSVGVINSAFRKPELRDSLELASQLGLQGVQLCWNYAGFYPERLTAAQRREMLDMIDSYGLRISAVCGDLGHGFGDPQRNPALIAESKRILEMSVECGTDIVTTHIGAVPEDPSDPVYGIMQDACGQLAVYADSLHAHFAVETGPEDAVVLKNFLDSLHSKGVAVNLDPANLTMVAGDDPVQAVYTLKDYIVHTHAKDGRKLNKRGEPNTSKTYIELPLGQGDVDFPNYLKALDEIGFHGFLTIEREVGEDPVGDVRIAVDFLNGLIKEKGGDI